MHTSKTAVIVVNAAFKIISRGCAAKICLTGKILCPFAVFGKSLFTFFLHVRKHVKKPLPTCVGAHPCMRIRALAMDPSTVAASVF